METAVKFLFLMIFVPTMASAQFDRFKSRSKFKGNEIKKESAGQKNGKTVNDKVFGKRDNGTDFVGSKKDSKFVNLNPETGFGPEIVTSFDFPDTDILEITKHMQKLTGINLILEKDIKGKVSITAPTPITVGDAWKAYLSALNMSGFALVKSGAFYKIISQRDLRTTPTKIYTGAYTPDTENHIMKVIALKHVSAKEITRNFRPFMSRYGRILDIEQTNTIIASDSGSNITRLEKLIKFVDVPGHESSLQIIPVRNSSAQEIAKLLKELIEDKASGGRRSRRSSKKNDHTEISKIIAEPRTNSIIAMATAEGARQLRVLIRKLDVRYSSKSSGKVHVYYLNYGDSEELAKTLSDLISNTQTKADASAKSGSRFVGSLEAATTIFNQEVKITADKNNNALVVTASPTDWLTLKGVIGKLDIPRDQVYVEGMILEASLTKIRSFGVEYAGAYGSGGAMRAGFGTIGAGASTTSLGSLLASNGTASLNGFFAGAGGGGTRTISLPTGDVTVNSVNALIKAVVSDENTNILATPQILCTDNTEAIFEIGETVPIRNTTSTAAGSVNSTSEQEAKLSLEITPQINKVTRFVKLKIKQKIDEFTGSKADASAGNGLGKTVRLAQTEVMIRDGDTIAMGGLLKNKESVITSKIPLLGDIPVLGWLFKSKTKDITKTNLLFFLTPKILSPYDKTAAKNSINLLKKRNKDIQESFSDDNPDPSKKLTEDLVKKLERQDQGPIYDTSFNDTFEKTNDDTEGMGAEDL